MITTIKQEKGFGATLMIDLSKYPHIQNNQKLQEILSQRLHDLLGNLESDLINKCTKELGDNKETNWRQIGDNKETNWRQIGDKLGDKLGDKKIIRMPSNSDCHPLPCLKSLAGNEARIMRYFFDHISQHHKLNLDKIILKDLVEALQIKESSLKKSFCRLTIKQFLIRHPGRRGQRGFLNFEVPLPIFNQMLTLNYTSNTCSTLNQLGDKLGDKSPPVVVVGINTPPISSSIKNYTDYNLDISRMEKLGFKNHHINQILKACRGWDDVPSKQDIQESFNQFCHDIETSYKKPLTNPVNMMMGIIRKHNHLYCTDNPKYQTVPAKENLIKLQEEERQLQILARERHKQKNAEIEKQNLAFEEWKEALDPQEKIAILKNKTKFLPEGLFLRAYYSENLIKTHGLI